MATFLQTNVSSLNAQRSLASSNNLLGRSLERLSSGLRINSPKDDAAGLQISNRLSSQINGLTQAQRNANDGISFAQVLEGALTESTHILQRMRTLTIQSLNGSNSDADRNILDAEYQQLGLEIDRIANNTTFGGIGPPMNGTITSLSFQVGANANQTVDLNMDNMTTASIMGGVGDIKTTTTANTELQVLDQGIKNVDSFRGSLGAFQNRMSSTLNNLSNISENVSSARSRIRDADYALESATLAKSQILEQSGLSIFTQANSSPQRILTLLQ
ncbi:MAG: flagellin FliC [Gammaproteobacteria bacterium CG22_combo_CG10-13_8_21_14_all_40_8]|nr:MAG: flagellin FliC [Gammaproteobacteria bacterium CG22_combo_CG10-13_8_21_14_all_40_8]